MMTGSPRIDWDSVDEALTGRAISGEELLVAEVALGLGFVAASLIGS